MALLVGALLALVALAYVFYPVVRPRRRVASSARPNGPGARSVSDEEIEAAVRSYRATVVAGGGCAACGARPEPDAIFCSNCGRRLTGEPPTPG
jgi:hypothetical protein